MRTDHVGVGVCKRHEAWLDEGKKKRGGSQIKTIKKVCARRRCGDNGVCGCVGGCC